MVGRVQPLPYFGNSKGPGKSTKPRGQRVAHVVLNRRAGAALVQNCHEANAAVNADGNVVYLHPGWRRRATAGMNRGGESCWRGKRHRCSGCDALHGRPQITEKNEAEAVAEEGSQVAPLWWIVGCTHSAMLPKPRIRGQGAGTDKNSRGADDAAEQTNG